MTMTDIYTQVMENTKNLGPDISAAMERLQTLSIWNKDMMKQGDYFYMLCGQGSAEWHKANNMDFVYIAFNNSRLLSKENGIISDGTADILAHLELDAIAAYGPHDFFVPINLKRYTQSSAGIIEDTEAAQIMKEFDENQESTADDPYAY